MNSKEHQINKIVFTRERNKQMPHNIDTNILLCVTMYNEAHNAFQKTYEGLLEASRYAYEQAGAGFLRNLKICFIIDGNEKFALSARKYIGKHNLIDYQESLLLPHNDTLTCYETKMQLEGISKSFWPTVYVAIKNKNQGKLDSHWWFFEKFAKPLEPDICGQLDIGTVPAEDALFNAMKRYDADSTLGGLATRLAISDDPNSSKLIKYQAGEFDFQSTFLWPSEQELGYIAVLPGQLNFIKWKIASDTDDEDAPVNKYLDGLQSDSPFTTTMFLAEDRVMAFELISNKTHRCQNVYAAEITAKTDACVTLLELLKQRKRWVNSAFACRIFMQCNLPSYLAHTRGSTVQKMHTIFAAFSVVLYQNIFLWFLPFFMVLSAVYTYKSIWFFVEDTFGTMLATAIVSLGFLPTFVLVFNQEEKVKKGMTNVLFIGSFVYGFFVMVIFPLLHALVDTSQRVVGVEFIVLFVLLIVMINLMLIKQKLKWSTLNNAIFYCFSSFSMSMLLSGYALKHINDHSWGTKGITKPHNWGTKQQSGGAKKSFDNFKIIVLSCYVFCNTFLLISTFVYHLKIANVLLIFIIFCVLLSGIASLIHVIKHQKRQLITTIKNNESTEPLIFKKQQ